MPQTGFTLQRSEPHYSSKTYNMSLKGSQTTADYMPWDTMLLLTQKLLRDQEYHFATLIALGCYTGLRISDLKQLRWSDIQSQITLTEQKTSKVRTVHLHGDLIIFLEKTRAEIAPKQAEVIFPYSLQYTNRKLKTIAKNYELDIRFSTHTFRKTFGRRICSKNNYSEKSLILLGQVFNHSSVAITKRYLGIRDKEIKDIYLTL
jgi:integrase